MPILDPRGDIDGLLSFLRREPVLNTIALGLLREAAEPAERGKWFFATVERGGRIVAAAFRSDFPKMSLAAEGDEDAMAELARLVQPAMPDVPCIVGKDEQLGPFVAEWMRLSGERGTPGMPERVQQLRVVRPQPAVPGGARRARVDELELAAQWMAAFFAESGAAEAARPGWAREAAAKHVGRGSLYFWLDPGPVCMAGGRETGEGVARIGPVYTPPAHRRRGYAGALVADLSQRLLDGGCHTCCLFTDVRNPTSNHVYADLGYQPVASVSEAWFRPVIAVDARVPLPLEGGLELAGNDPASETASHGTSTSLDRN